MGMWRRFFLVHKKFKGIMKGLSSKCVLLGKRRKASIFLIRRFQGWAWNDLLLRWDRVSMNMTNRLWINRLWWQNRWGIRISCMVMVMGGVGWRRVNNFWGRGVIIMKRRCLGLWRRVGRVYRFSVLEVWPRGFRRRWGWNWRSICLDRVSIITTITIIVKVIMGFIIRKRRSRRFL